MSLSVWEWSTESFIIKQAGFSAGVVAFSKDGAVVATGGRDDGKLKLWNAMNGICFASFEEHEATISGIAFFPKGNALITSSYDGTLKAFDLVRYRCFRTYTTPVHAALQCVSLDASGELVVAGAREPYTVFIWGVKSGSLIDSLSGHEAPISYC